MVKLNPEEDGITHVNIYSQGKTELGRLLSNFAHFPFEHPRYGFFTSVEGFWYWFNTVDKDSAQILRTLSGWEAKKQGRKLAERDWNNEEDFKKAVIQALQVKAEHPRTVKLLSENLLPFEHYYVYNGKVIEPKEGKWILDFWNSKTEFGLR